MEPNMFNKKFNFVFLLIVFLSLFIFNNSNAQITLQAGGGASLVIPEGDLSGTTMDYYSGKNYGLGSGFNLHAKVKAGLLGFILFGELDYNSLSNNGYSIPGEGSVDISQKIISLKAGPEFQLNIPASSLTPYLEANLGLNFFSGDVTFQGVANVPDADYVIQSASRIGLGLGGGVIIRLNPLVRLDIGIEYDFMNLLGKSFDDVNPLVNQRLDSYLSLNDDKDPAYSQVSNIHVIGNSRSINSMQVSATILIGI
jgi:opacity protein-like surface antigen